ncbi:RNA-guided endonuclease InsQ/TnpB family protein [Nostoc sp. CMAA1605]|uniref:RNA-guided endonuclease InsQ/TnpB family protein n=1 Tax=Nostoc sp. CMAA1605 TaxID=2055159 RepID=UPI001F1D5B11|nr:transposase [Nostoc sp. CMAA1605]MCF4968336.1 transposase [Nostoc sp. CMAA1605]
MEQVLTLVCKLNPSQKQAEEIELVLKAFESACNYANQKVKPQITSKTTIQNMVYNEIRALFGLSASLAVRACARVGANRKTAKLKDKPVKVFKPTSADYDARIFSFREKDWTVSLTLMNGREHIKIDAGNYQRGKLKGRKPTSAQLCKHRDGNYYIHIQIKDKTPEPIKSTPLATTGETPATQWLNNVIGVDFGRRDIAVTSNGDKWDGKQINDVRDKFSRVRSSLQKKATKGTRSTRRRARQILQRLSGKERRFQQWLNHNISRSIIQDALKNNAAVAIEDLTGIRKRTNQKPRSKTERRRSNSWSFYQLRSFLEYKGVQFGVEIIAVPPAWTSQACHQCLQIGLRSEKRFKCTNEACSWSGDADLNGAKNIAAIGVNFVNSPRGSKCLCCELSVDSSGLLKAYTAPVIRSV